MGQDPDLGIEPIVRAVRAAPGPAATAPAGTAACRHRRHARRHRPCRPGCPRAPRCALPGHAGSAIWPAPGGTATRRARPRRDPAGWSCGRRCRGRRARRTARSGSCRRAGPRRFSGGRLEPRIATSASRLVRLRNELLTTSCTCTPRVALPEAHDQRHQQAMHQRVGRCQADDALDLDIDAHDVPVRSVDLLGDARQALGQIHCPTRSVHSRRAADRTGGSPARSSRLPTRRSTVEWLTPIACAARWIDPCCTTARKTCRSSQLDGRLPLGVVFIVASCRRTGAPEVSSRRSRWSARFRSRCPGSNARSDRPAARSSARSTGCRSGSARRARWPHQAGVHQLLQVKRQRRTGDVERAGQLAWCHAAGQQHRSRRGRCAGASPEPARQARRPQGFSSIFPF